MRNTLLALLGLFLLSTPLAASAQQFGDFTYTSSAGVDTIEITITGYTGPGGALTIPDTINSFPVTAVGDNAFNNKTNLTSITIPWGLTSIGSHAFESCTSLTTVTLPDSLNDIGISAFSGCTSLTGIAIPSSVSFIGHGTFSFCISLIAINVDAANAFFSSLDGVLFNKSQTTLVEYLGGKPGSYSIPGTVTSIGSSAFAFCTSLTSVTIAGGVTNIGDYAFEYCTKLTGVTIPGGVTSIGGSAFESCASLTSVTIPGSVTNIDNFVFFGCTSLTNITIPDNVTSIGYGAFENSTNLEGVFFKGNTPSFGSYVFVGDNTLTVYYLPGTTGWGATFADRPAVLWNPLMQSSGVGPAGFGFNINGTADIPIVIEAATNLVSSSWVPLQSLNLTNGAFYFSDPGWTNYPARFYRFRSP
jgi:hypothetical protein